LLLLLLVVLFLLVLLFYVFGELLVEASLERRPVVGLTIPITWNTLRPKASSGVLQLRGAVAAAEGASARARRSGLRPVAPRDERRRREKNHRRNFAALFLSGALAPVDDNFRVAVVVFLLLLIDFLGP
jgi:hypothetical protein